jgi:inner membrane protein
MASVFSHAVAALAIGTAFRQPGPPARFWVAGALCAVAPDLDVVGVWLGIPFGHMLGHRGITHSLPFAAALAAVVAWTASANHGGWGWLWLYLFLATASHGLLDGTTDGGIGVAFFAPFSNDRYFLPWRVIPVSPISLGRFFSARGVTIMRGEIVWIWLPAAVLALVGVAARRWRRTGA